MSKVQYVYKDELIVAWTCVSCGKSNKTAAPSVDTVGGCFGHESYEYCYCSQPQSNFTTKCKCGIETIVTL